MFCYYIESSSPSIAQKVTISMSAFAQLTQLQFRPATASVHSGATLQVELSLRCLMPVSVRLQQLAASIHFSLEQGGTHGRSKGPQRQTYPGTVHFSQGNSSGGPQGTSSDSGPSLELDEIQDRSPSDNSLNSAGMVCKNTHLVMRRHDSSSSPDTPNCVSPPLAVDDGAQMLKVQDLTLEPGRNTVVFTAPVRPTLLLFTLTSPFTLNILQKKHVKNVFCMYVCVYIYTYIFYLFIFSHMCVLVYTHAHVTYVWKCTSTTFIYSICIFLCYLCIFVIIMIPASYV